MHCLPNIFTAILEAKTTCITENKENCFGCLIFPTDRWLWCFRGENKSTIVPLPRYIRSRN